MLLYRMRTPPQMQPTILTNLEVIVYKYCFVVVIDVVDNADFVLLALMGR